jgi:hypothetical protein
VFFMAAALAAFVLPSTGDAVEASLANSATLTGALCFLIGTRLLTRTDIETPDAPSERQADPSARPDASRRPGPSSISPHPADDASADPSYGQHDPIPSGTRP